MKALNFYSSVYHASLIAREKRCTVRLGDKSAKYREGDLVWVTYGNRFAPRKRVFAAVLDKVEVKALNELSGADIRAENPDLTGVDDVARFLTTVYDRPVSPEETVTVIYFSEVVTG